MGGKKKKFLVQAITLGLLLAVPLGVQAKDYTQRVTGNRSNYPTTPGMDNILTIDNINNKYTYNFSADDRLICNDPMYGANAVYLYESTTDNKIFDLGNLGYIEYTRNDSGDTLRAILVAGENKKLILRDCNIKAEGNFRYIAGVDAISYSNKGSIDIDFGKVDINAVSSYNGSNRGIVYGIVLSYKSTATLGESSTINTSGCSGGFLKAWGVCVKYASKGISLGNNTTINTNLEYTGDGVITAPDYEGVGDKDSDPVKSNGESVGIYADSGLVSVEGGLTINSTGYGTGSVWVRGINAQMSPDNSGLIPDVDIKNNATINIMNKAITGTAYGMFINAGSVSFGDNAKIISQAQIDNNMKNTNENGIKVRGIYIDTSNNNIWSEDVIKNTNAIVEFGDGATIQAINNSKGGETTGVYAHDSVVFKGASQIVAEAGSEGKHDSYGVYATSEKGDVDLGTASVISVINNSNASTAYTAGIKAVDSSKVTMRGGSISGKSADGENFKAIVTSDAAQVNVNADGAQNIIVEGDLEADSQSQIKMRANDAQSYLIGAVTTAYEENVDDDSKTKTDLTFKNTTWYLTGDSNVTNLTLDNGIVSMVENANLARTVSGNAQKLSIDKALNGSGTFIMDLKYYDNDVKSYENATDSDFIYIHGGDNSEQRLVFKDNNSNLGAMASDAKLYFAQIKNNAATFGDGGDSVTDGGEKYDTVTAINEKGIYDLEFYIDSEQNAEQADYNDWFITGKTNKSNPNGDGPIHSYNAGFALWRDDDTLLKRLGELRFTNDEGGAWARVIGKKLEDNRSLGFNTHAKTVQVGYDRKDVQEDGSGTWRKGVALGHTWADTSFRGGRGENNYTDLTLYATNIRKHDHYWDLVARIGYIDSEYDTAYGDRGEFDNWAGSLSAEYGRKKKLNEDNWFIEPQAQLTYSYMWGDSYTTRNGARVVQSDADSLVGRAGFIISKEIESERKYPHRYYAKAFIMHEFLDGGDNNIYFDSDRLYGGSDFKDTWYVAGVGANVDMGNSCTFYFDAERNFKAHVKMPYRIEAGFRWEF